MINRIQHIEWEMKMGGLLMKCRYLLVILLWTVFISVFAQDTIPARVPKALMHRERKDVVVSDSIMTDSADVQKRNATTVDSLVQLTAKEIRSAIGDSSVMKQTITVPSAEELRDAIRDKVFVPNPKTAMWLAIAIPGGGQIYNRKYWKLPIIYGGFLGCVYALNWNSTMYRDYSQAYIDIMDNDPNTKSYENFIPRGYDINKNLTRIQDLFKRKKNFYRRYRDLSLFCMIGVYALSIIDAYVDAELSSFDISRDLSLKVRPSIIHDKNALAARYPYRTQAYGVECSINF